MPLWNKQIRQKDVLVEFCLAFFLTPYPGKEIPNL